MPIIGRHFGPQNPSQLTTVSLNIAFDAGNLHRYLPVWVPGPGLESVELYYIHYGVGDITGAFSDNIIQVPDAVDWNSPVTNTDTHWVTSYTLGSQYDIDADEESFMIKNDDHTPLKVFTPITKSVILDEDGRSLVGDILFRLKMNVDTSISLTNLYAQMAYRANYSAIGESN